MSRKPISIDFSLSESIIKGIQSTPDLRQGSVNINITNVELVTGISEAVKNGNEILDHINKNVESAKNNYESAIKSFFNIQELCKQKTSIGLAVLVEKKEGNKDE